MHILQLEIENFKSFHGRTVIPFRRGFTTVSGPNGSGKSNIVDSLLFCLGLSTSRTMRAEKLTDLINNTTRKREASVSVTFSKNGQDVELPVTEETLSTEANEEPTETFSPATLLAEEALEEEQALPTADVPDNLLTITRRVKEAKSGTQSQFYVNGKPSSLGEVHEMLSAFNVSPGCYNVMMQGDVASIVTMSATERRKILDEAAGIGEFDRKIDQANGELATTASNLERYDILLGEITERLTQLQGEREKALRYQSLKEEAERLGHKTQLVKLKELQSNLEAAKANVQRSKEQRKTASTTLDALKGSILSSTQHLQEVTAAVKKKGEDQYLALFRQLETLRGHIARKQDGIVNTQQQIKENEQAITKHLQEQDRQRGLLETVTVELGLLSQQEKELLEQFTAQEAAYKRLSEQFSAITNHESAWAVSRHEVRKNLEQVADSLAHAQREAMALQAEQQRVQQASQQSQQAKLNAQSEAMALQGRYNALSKSFEQLETDKEAAERTLADLKQQRTELWAALNRSKDKLGELSTEKARLESRKRALEDMNFGRAVELVLRSDLPGVLGMVGQLVQVPSEYAMAIETAMGGRLQNVVVENDAVAQRCIQFLQQQRAGRATFLPLNKLKTYGRPRNAPITGGVIDYALNLVSFDPAYEDVFCLALGDTLVVEDVEAGRSLLNKYRMVTLDGSIFEKTGAMTGGSSGKPKGSGLFEGAALEKQLEAASDRYEEQLLNKQKLEGQLNRLEAELEQATEALKRIENQHNRSLLELENLEQQLQKLRPASVVASGEQEVTPGEDTLVVLARQLEQNQRLQSQLASEQEAFRQQLEAMDTEAQGEAVERLREELTDVKFQMDYYDSQLRQLRADLKQKQTDEHIRTDLLAEHTEQATRKQAAIGELQKTIIGFEEEIASTEQQVKHLESESAALDSELKQLQSQRDAAQAQLLELERERNTLERALHQAEEQVLANQSRVRELEAHSASLYQQLTPLFESFTDETTGETGLDAALKESLPTESALNSSITKLENQWKALEPVNMLAIKEFEQVNARQQELSQKLETLGNERTALLAKISSYEELKRINFNRTFESVNTHFSTIYAELADGAGNLLLTNEEDPLQGGLTIVASPRGKKLQRLEAMSGGEKSLTSLAFVFALQRTMPAPFYALDEVDQNLDGLNVEKLSNMVQREAQMAQFIVVSLRKPMLDNSDRTVGVTQRQNGVSKVTGIQFR